MSDARPLIGFIPLTKDEFNHWFLQSCTLQAEMRARLNKTRPDEEMATIKAEVKQLLPEGQKTPGHYFRGAVVDEEIVGFIWAGPMQRLGADETFLYDIIVAENHRRNGYARFMLQEMHRLLKREGYHAVYLFVLDENPAKELYLSEGYQIQTKKSNSLLMIRYLE